MDGKSDTLHYGLGASPALADHGFQGLTVLPGAWYIAAALKRAGCPGGVRVRDARFERPLILADDPHAVRLEAQGARGAVQRYVFSSGETVLARLELEPAGAEPVHPAPPPADFPGALSAPELYARLEANGNRYGPRFQRLTSIAMGGGRAAARLAFETAPAGLDPLWIDAAVQALAALVSERGHTFVLRGVAEAYIAPEPRPPVSAAAELEGELAGNVTLFDAAGRPSVILRGVSFSFLENAAAALPLVVTATFTADPIEEGLRFWADEIKLPVEPRFAPYSQVFQELLDPDSQSRRNRSGSNAFLINLADWMPAASVRGVDAGSASWPAGVDRHTLPNGMEVAHLNTHETEYVFQEIFADRCYLRHGVALPAGATVIDIGANIGLFSLFVRTERPDAVVYSYEPSPIAFRALEANCQAYGPGLHPVNAGVARERGQADLTFYCRSSVFSSFHPDAAEDRGAIQTVVENMVRGELGADSGPVDEYVHDLMADRMDARTFACPMVSVSNIIRDHGLRRIDLLKIDAEKCELDILRGIDDEHWPLIQQVVVEVHDRTRAALAETQAILTAQGFRCACEEERLLAGSGLFNVYAVRDYAAAGRPAAAESEADRRWLELQAKAEEFERALAAYAGGGAPPAVLVFCPPPPHGLSRQEQWQFSVIEERLAAQARSLPSLTVVDSATLRQRHPSADWHLGAKETAGHIPYTPEGFALLATAVMRAVAAERRAPFKAIAVDCDHTLWHGVCGEEGPLGVSVTPAHRAIQEFLLRQMRSGMMLCLCSKNEESDVWAVFERNPGMVLKREHIAASRISWAPKSEGLSELARSLNIGLDAFIFLDDNPVEIAEIAARCPGVFPIALPSPLESSPGWLEHHWVFDSGRITAEDQARTRLVREAAQRERFRETTATLGDFIAGLQLQVRVAPAQPADLGRLAQLTQRTNQFNFTTLRRSEFELRRYLQEQDGRALAVEVRDRFGDYGTVGLVLYQLVGTVCCVDTFLLSCRVLGRGVEHQVLAALAAEAIKAGAATIELPLRITAKNRPAADFVASLPAAFTRPESDATIHGFEARSLRELRYAPDARRPAAAAAEAAPAPAPAAPPNLSGLRLSADAWGRIAALAADANRLRAAVDEHRLRRAGADPSRLQADVPATLSGKLLALWRRILANPQAGLDQNFFDAGGSSLKAVQVVAAIRRELRLPVTVTQFFECPTVRLLSQKLDPAGHPSATDGSSDALERGARRKARLRRTAA